MTDIFLEKGPISAWTYSLTQTLFHARYEYPVSQQDRKQTDSGLSGWLYQVCGGQACQAGVGQVRLIVKQRNTTRPPPLPPFPIPSAFLSPPEQLGPTGTGSDVERRLI